MPTNDQNITFESLDQETPAGDLEIADGKLGLLVASPSAEHLAERGLVSWELAQLMDGLHADARYVLEGVAGLLRADGAATSTQSLAHDLRVKKSRVDELLEEARNALRSRILDSALIDVASTLELED